MMYLRVQLGNGMSGASYVPIPPAAVLTRVVSLTAGAEHTCAVTAAGGLLCWGRNSNGQLGDGVSHGQDEGPPQSDSAVPQLAVWAL